MNPPLLHDGGVPSTTPAQRQSRPLSLDTTTHHRPINGHPAIPVPATPQHYSMHGDATLLGQMATAMPTPTSPKHKSEFGYSSAQAEKRDMRKRADTAHVPCKFFLQGQCQAGRMCPFSHDIESSTRPAPCKYFAKGGCKFGRKCALLHITPDGTVVNRPVPQNFHFPPHMPPGGYAPPPPGLISMQAHGLDQRPNGDGMPEYEHCQYGPRNGYEQRQIDMTLTSASPKYGSPPDHRLGVSPPPKSLSVLDAPLPNSFDSNGISMAARNGPFAASVPSRFGIESPPSSLPRKSQLGNTALRDLHSSAFGDRGMDGVLAMGSSPPSGPDEPLTFAKRPLHSDRLRASRPMLSASVGTRLPTASFEYSDDDDADGGEDLLPASIRDLISEGGDPREPKGRGEEESPANFLSAARRTLSGHGTPQDSKLGSLGTSPSRYSSVFQQQRQQSSSKPDGDGLGHVGSPLRNSGFTINSVPRSNGELSTSISSPPRQSTMSALSQELQRTKLGVAARPPTTSHPAAPARTVSNGSTGRSSLDRGMSSSSVTKIDEEQELFDMDGVDGSSSSRASGEGFGAIGGHRAAK